MPRRKINAYEAEQAAARAMEKRNNVAKQFKYIADELPTGAWMVYLRISVGDVGIAQIPIAGPTTEKIADTLINQRQGQIIDAVLEVQYLEEMTSQPVVSSNGEETK